jgi:DNA invertase Pin-like site-specific DNA recombinase
MRVAIYARVSTGDQNSDRQVRELKAFAKRLRAKVVGIHKETASGAKNDRSERKKVLDLAQARQIDAVLVSELSRWGRSLLDLIETLQALQSWKVSMLAVSGLQLDLSTPHGKLLAGVLASLAEFERDLVRERVKSGLAAARARGKVLGRQKGFRPKSDKLAPRVMKLVEAGQSYRQIAGELQIDKSTVVAIVRRARN